MGNCYCVVLDGCVWGMMCVSTFVGVSTLMGVGIGLCVGVVAVLVKWIDRGI